MRSNNVRKKENAYSHIENVANNICICKKIDLWKKYSLKKREQGRLNGGGYRRTECRQWIHTHTHKCKFICKFFLIIKFCGGFLLFVYLLINFLKKIPRGLVRSISGSVFDEVS